MTTSNSEQPESMRIRAVRNDDSTAALRKIARACIAIARQQLEEEERQARRQSATPSTSDDKEDDRA